MNKKILIFASYAPSFIAFRLHLIKAWLAAGYEVFACAPIEDDPDINKTMQILAKINVTFIPIQLKRTNISPFADIKLIIQLSRLIKSNNITHLFSYTMKPVVFGSLAAKIVGVQNIYSMITGMGYLFSASDFKTYFTRIIAKLLLKTAMNFNKGIFFQNKDNLSDFQQFGIIKHSHKTTLVNGSGVNIDEFMPALYPSKITFLLTARLLVNKGIREYIKAATIIKKHQPQVRFLLVGWIDDNPNAISETELTAWVNSEIIEYYGRLMDVRPVIAESSIFVLPSYSEGLPRSVIEAMAMSRPIITTDVPGCRETVLPGKNGFLVPKQNHLALAEAMKIFIDNPEIISTMGVVSRQIAVDKYDVHKVNQTILNAMEG